MSAKKKTKEKASGQQYSTLREYFLATVYCTIIALFVTTYVVHPMTVPTPSMEPTILVGDRLLIDKFNYRNGFNRGSSITPSLPIERGDIIVFKYPEQPEILYVKRAIGLPGETLEIRDKKVYVNGQPIDEPYKVHRDSITHRRTSDSYFLSFDSQRDNYGPVVVPEESYFMMGDNRDDSADSRYFGFLQRDYVVGRPLIVFWSYEDSSDAYLKTTLPEMVKLYAERVVFFFTRTRWSRMGHLVR
jgi:signal peptidase I